MGSKTYLNDSWSVYFHDNTTNWDNDSFHFVTNITSVDNFCEVFKSLHDCWYSGMFFIFRSHIMPRWEDEHNIDGGCYSIKVNSNDITEKWFDLCSSLLGETIGKEEIHSLNVNGISITPKKNSNVIRVWLKDNTLAQLTNYNITGSKYSTILYKKHSNV